MKRTQKSMLRRKVAAALTWIDTARDDLRRGDLLDAIDSLRLAMRHLQDVRAAAHADARPSLTSGEEVPA